jgi:hypothetical protein
MMKSDGIASQRQDIVKKTLQTLYRGNQGQQELARCEIIP